MADFNQSPLGQLTIALAVRQPALLATSGAGLRFSVGWLQRPFVATASLSIRQPALLATSGAGLRFAIGWSQRPTAITQPLPIGSGSSAPPVTVPSTGLIWPVGVT